ncbi:F-box domain protein [Cladophialophora carrionii]|uniref:F-box domain protein n=1 Tax=Cladophialophora carrionii TaxID=86049 RepID=A0A1C1CCE2_9EURO|nr:F-box domain protein [Cladophialophora carrionii]
MEHLFPYPKMGTSFLEVLHDALTRKLLGFDATHAEPTPFISGVTSRLKFVLSDATQQLSILKIGYTALEAFLQANCTGPPLDFDPEEVIFPEWYRRREDLAALREGLFQHLSVDGCRPYALTPHIELFWLAKVIMSTTTLAEAGFNGRRARMRVNFWHQKLLSEESPSLRDVIYSDAAVLEQQLSARLAFGGSAAEEHYVEFMVERAVIRTYYGDDALARTDLARAALTRDFHFVLTGALGKRTKFQENDTSQLVVLAKSRDHEPEPYSSRKNSKAESHGVPDAETASSSLSLPLPQRTMTPTSTSTKNQQEPTSPQGNRPVQPENVLLNDDTLLERIHFKTTAEPSASSPLSSSLSVDTMTHVAPSQSSLPPELAALDPADQPLLFPMDSAILLATASSITNTSPEDGLVREETLPYATRVLDGGSSNWQVYTQALLVRSRIEGYRARTAERGLLQLQALVDQVIAETSQSVPPSKAESSESHESKDTTSTTASTGTSTFLPKPKPSESASVAERLKYIYQLSPPLRWELEAELAQRWTSMGGLKTALEIYTRLQMHAEVALCLAATDQEAKAVELLKNLLFTDDPSGSSTTTTAAQETATPGREKLRSPPPADAPRLLCILGDIVSQPDYYALSWTVSSSRYARAQRSLGRYFLTKQRDYQRAAEAYRLALNISRLDRASWFSLGCIQLELEEWTPAVESFTRCVQLEDQDAESWSNLAVALLSLPKPVAEEKVAFAPPTEEDESQDQDQNQTDRALSPERKVDPYRHVRDALRALRRAATLKRDDPRIWDNYLTVAASIPPSAGTPWAEIIQAMSRVIELRGKKEGESCIDLGILKVLTEYVIENWKYPSPDGDRDGDGDGDGEEAEKAEQPEAEGANKAEQPQAEAGVEHKTTSEEKNSASASTTTTTGPPNFKLPYTPRSFLHLIDKQVTPLATSSAKLYTLLSRISEWRSRPQQSLMQAEKAWLATLTLNPTTSSASAATAAAAAAAASASDQDFTNIPASQWTEIVDKTIWMMRRYADLGPKQRERTGGEVEAKWRFKARSAARRVLGRGKTWEESGEEGALRLRRAMDEVRELCSYA